MKMMLETKYLADRLFSDIIRKRGVCELPVDEYCLKNKSLEAAHILPRSYYTIRWSLDNALCLCHNCHFFYTNHNKKWKDDVKKKIGVDKYQELQNRGNTYQKIDYDRIISDLRKSYYE